MGPYARRGNQWVSFDDQAMIRHKSQYVYYNNLGGAMIWALDLDDFRYANTKIEIRIFRILSVRRTNNIRRIGAFATVAPTRY